MSDTTTLKKLIGEARSKLDSAQTKSIETHRPENVCAGHDSMNSLLCAVANGLDTVLLISEGRLETGLEHNPYVMPERVTSSNWPEAWKFINSNGKTIIAWIGIVCVAIVLKGELKTVLDKLPSYKDNHVSMN